MLCGHPRAGPQGQPGRSGIPPSGVDWTGSHRGYTPADLAAAYGYNPNVNRKSQLIGIVDWNNDPNARKDLNAFDAHYGLPKETSTSFRQVKQSGGTKLPGSNAQTSATLTAGRKPKSPPPNSPATTIQAVVNGTADKSAGIADFPATDPNVVAVGGTSLVLKSNGSRATETVWNDNGPDDLNYLEAGEGGGAGGGGCSKRYTAPAWQSHYSGYSARGCGGKRLDAHVAAIADPETGFDVLDTYSQKSNGGWVTVGGTSLASPVVAAMWALAGGSGGTAYPASSLYVNGTVRPTGHYDVTSGGNSFCGGDTTTNCATVTEEIDDQVDNPNGLGAGLLDCGYDGPSGLGAPRGLAMFTPTSPKVSVTVPSARVHQSGTYRASVTERSTATQITGYTWVWGDGSSTKGTTASAHHTYSKAGTYTATLTVSDSRYQATVDRFRVKVAS